MRIWNVARRELKSLFDQPTGYVLLVAFLATNAFFYFRSAYLSQVASLRPMLDLLPWEFLFFVPAVTMRSLAEDARGGQLEVVLAQPLSELELLLGKYLAAVLFLWIALALSLPIPIALSFGAAMPWPMIVTQYVGAGLLAAGLAAIGVWASSLSRSQITAFILAAVPMFLLILVGLNPLLVGLPASIAAVAARVGVLAHFDGIGRGVLDLRDVVYFLSLAGFFLALAYGALLGRKLAPSGGGRRRLRAGVALLAASLLVVNLLGGYIAGRLDLSPGRAYTLSPATRRMLAQLDDLVTIKVFASAELPTEVALMKRDVDDLLHDLRSAGKSRLRVVERDPSTDDAARQEAQSLGIQPVQFKAFFHLARLQRIGDRLLPPLDDQWRQPARTAQCIPRNGFESRYARFGDSRNVRQRATAFQGRDCDDAQPSGTHLRRNHRRAAVNHLDLAAEHVS